MHLCQFVCFLYKQFVGIICAVGDITNYADKSCLACLNDVIVNTLIKYFTITYSIVLLLEKVFKFWHYAR